VSIYLSTLFLDESDKFIHIIMILEVRMTLIKVFNIIILILSFKQKLKVYLLHLSQVWKKDYKWLNVDFIGFEEGWKHFTSFSSLVKSKRLANTHHVIWLTTTCAYGIPVITLCFMEMSLI
jgi:c-di-GMP-related signal transduction protein